MAFGDSTKEKSSTSNTGSSPFMDLGQGERLIRVLSEDEFSYWRYWMNVNTGGGQKSGRSIIVGRDNPIRPRMDEIGKGNPGYVSPSRRFAINVLDRTLVIKLADGTTVYPNASGDYVFNKAAVQGVPEPNNVVKILEFGPQLMDLFINLNGRMRSRVDRSQITILQTDVMLNISGEKMDRVITPMQTFDPAGENPVPAGTVTYLYDLHRIYAPFPANAIIDLIDNDVEWNTVMKSLNRDGEYPTVLV